MKPRALVVGFVSAAILLGAESAPAAEQPSPPAEQHPSPTAEQPSPAVERPTPPAREVPRAQGSGPVDPAPPSANEPPKPPPARTLSGTVRSVEAGPKIVVEGPDAPPVTVAVDRNTAIYRHRGMGTVRDLRVGEPVRVSVSGPDNRALWLELTERGGDVAEGGATSPPSVPPGEMAPSGGSGPPGSAPVPPGPSTPTAPGAPGAPGS